MVFKHMAKEVLVEVLPRRSIETEVVEVLSIQDQENSWMTPWMRYLKEG